MSRKKKMDIEEFVEFGYLQEANRRFFNPLGLQLEVKKGEAIPIDEVGDDQTWTLALNGIWDKRSYDEGILLSKVDADKVVRVTSEMKRRRVVRRALPECNSSGFQKVPRE